MNQSGQAAIESLFVCFYLCISLFFIFIIGGLFWNQFWSRQIAYEALMCAENQTATLSDCEQKAQQKLYSFIIAAKSSKQLTLSSSVARHKAKLSWSIKTNSAWSSLWTTPNIKPIYEFKKQFTLQPSTLYQTRGLLR